MDYHTWTHQSWLISNSIDTSALIDTKYASKKTSYERHQIRMNGEKWSR